MISRTLIPLALRFARYLHPAGEGCWLWNGAKNEHGYGVIGRGARGQGNAKAHRVAFEIFHGVRLQPSVTVLHRCDNPACVNPLHLASGTQRENLADMRRKGRGAPPPIRLGVEQPLAKLDPDKVRQIFQLHRTGMTSNQLASHFGVSRATIHAVLTRKTWRHIDVPDHLG
ncbi:HNH endonuclease [Eleftheria terrae]|uniref:HNH endonuclease n=1 Tax=Eleftheria terrae TaxID=1597781 RepID=UPI00263BA525|nr:HNH endonuclease [Eleftheria terrae]WKB55988.1 HNH endonuclease [Eleftheria terrae]